MSLIAGIYNLDGRPVEPGAIVALIDAAAHRGPDRVWHRIDGPVALGHRALGTTPGPPNGSPSSWISFDGRLDNRGELGESLGLIPARLRELSDSDLALAVFHRFGSGFAEKLIGDFALVLWDERARRLVCARDAVGVKPLYYRLDGTTLVVASEPKQILALPGVETRPNLGLVARYLMDDYSESEETLYDGIRRLPPAHILIAEPGGTARSRYWDVDPAHRVRYRTEEEYDAHFRDLFRKAVAVRLRASGSVGALLSGGLDSSSIVCTARDVVDRGEASPDGFETWSMLFDDLPCDERDYVRAVVDRTGFPASYVRFQLQDAVSDLDGCRTHPDVRYSPITRALMPVLRQASHRGVRVMLSGTGGDEFLAPGFHHLTDLLLRGRLATLARQLRSDAVTCGASPAWLVREFCLKPLVPRSLRRCVRRALRSLDPGRTPDWIVPGLLEHVGVDSTADREPPAGAFESRAQRFLYEVLRFNSNLTYAVGENDQLASMHSMEYRYPFLDRRLIEFLIAIPQEHRWWMDRPKTILRRALRDILPDEVRRRRDKAAFGVVFDRELQGRIAGQVDALIRKSTLASLGVIEPGPLHRRFTELVAGRADDRSRWAVFNFIGLEIWSRTITGIDVRGGAA